ncbi:MAG: sulfite exporter TauE/SafE family protein [Cyanobacteria bacterium SBLK]|nr:sulfite exporter TauE/SafE family protein [Cyanobacteria bacterium SBLK]
MLESLQTQLYQISQFAEAIVAAQLDRLGIISIAIVLIAGLLTSLTPCMLSMLPITIAYIGGYEGEKESDRWQGAIQSAWFALGLASTLAGLGIVAASLGKVYGQIGIGLPIFVSLVAILMGLNLLEIVPLRFPSLGGSDWISSDLPKGIRSYLLGLTFGLVASPCSTPVLAALLAWVGKTQNIVMGGVLLLCYAIGYVAPLILAGTFTASLKKLLELRRWSSWINPASGVLLIGFGTFSLLSRISFLLP